MESIAFTKLSVVRLAPALLAAAAKASMAL